MYYVIFAQDIPGTLEKRLAVREQHLARLKQLQAEGRLLTAGPNPAIDDEKSRRSWLYWLDSDCSIRKPVCSKRLGVTRSLRRSWRLR